MQVVFADLPHHVRNRELNFVAQAADSVTAALAGAGWEIKRPNPVGSRTAVSSQHAFDIDHWIDQMRVGNIDETRWQVAAERVGLGAVMVALPAGRKGRSLGAERLRKAVIGSISIGLTATALIVAARLEVESNLVKPEGSRTDAVATGRSTLPGDRVTVTYTPSGTDRAREETERPILIDSTDYGDAEWTLTWDTNEGRSARFAILRADKSRVGLSEENPYMTIERAVYDAAESKVVYGNARVDGAEAQLWQFRAGSDGERARVTYLPRSDFRVAFVCSYAGGSRAWRAVQRRCARMIGTAQLDP